jgi:uncharacterized protein (UPF0210 family)
MKIRSITYFCDPGWPLEDKALRQAGEFISAAQQAFESVGYEVQTTRLAIPPFPLLLPKSEPELAVQLAMKLETSAHQLGFAYASIGPALPAHPWSYCAVKQVIAASQNVFTSAFMTDGLDGVSLAAVHACGRAIYEIARLSDDGFSNLRFGALANVQPGGPFFPAAYHAGGPPTFALATEAADLAVEAFRDAQELEQARRSLIAAVERHTRKLSKTAQGLVRRYGVEVGGFDFTLAPFPQPDRSFGRAMELLGVTRVGLHGSLAAAAILTDTLDQAAYPRVGFNGLMLPVLEDSVLAQRAAEGVLTIKDLLLYAAVCGTGLDTVPLPGDISAEALSAVLLDVASLSQRLKKPLIARLMPIPGKAAGDAIDFDFPYFASSRVLAVQADSLHSGLAGDATYSLRKRS